MEKRIDPNMIERAKRVLGEGIKVLQAHNYGSDFVVVYGYNTRKYQAVIDHNDYIVTNVGSEL